MINLSSTIYDGWKLYGPYTSKKDGRLRSVLVKDGRKVTISYPKLLLELHLGRHLNEEETVDHINGDFTDNRIENLQILTRSGNSKKSVKVRDKCEAVCIWCNSKFILTRHQVLTRAKKNAGPFCGRSCVGLYGTTVQNGGSVLQRTMYEQTYTSGGIAQQVEAGDLKSPG